MHFRLKPGDESPGYFRLFLWDNYRVRVNVPSESGLVGARMHRTFGWYEHRFSAAPLTGIRTSLIRF